MKIKISTTYENVTEEFLQDWLEEINLPELQGVTKDLKEFGHATHKSKDPTSDCVGTTEYLIVR